MAFQANLTARSQSHNFNSQSPTTLQITGGERIHEAISSRFIWQLLNNSSPNIRKNSFLMNAKENFIERKKKGMEKEQRQKQEQREGEDDNEKIGHFLECFASLAPSQYIHPLFKSKI